MTTLTKFIIGLIVSFMLMSCQFDGNFGFGATGNGNVQKVDRDLSGEFDEIEVSRGMDVYLTQGDSFSVTVEADENLHDIIMTEIENNTLYVYADENIRSAKARKVMVSFEDVSKISATSGSDVYSTNIIKTESLVLRTTSGADMELEIDVNVAECSSTSGSDLRVSGRTNKLYADATSGSDIKAGNLITRTCEAKATSGADITVNTSEELIAKATSGGDIKYHGNPEKITKKDGVSGSIRKQ